MTPQLWLIKMLVLSRCSVVQLLRETSLCMRCSISSVGAAAILPRRNRPRGGRSLHTAASTSSDSLTTMAIEVLPIPVPPSVDKTRFSNDFGREIRGVKPGELDDAQFKEISDLLYKVGPLCYTLFRNQIILIFLLFC